MSGKIFVTGAPGWLGTRFSELVLKREAPAQTRDYQLRCLVYPGLEEGELKGFGADIVRGNVSHRDTFRGAMTGCDAVVHMVGIIHPKRVREFYEINYHGTEYILEEAVASGVKRIIFISSNSPAGFSQPGQLLTEDDAPHPYMNYGRSKSLAEQLLLQAAREKKIEAVILRPCWYYGPRQPARQTKFFRMIKKGRPVLFGDGSNLRSVSYIDNVIQGIILALEKDHINGETFWIADERPYTTLEIYQTLARLLGTEKLTPLRIPAFSSWVFEQTDALIQATGHYQQEIHVAGEMARNIACSIEKAKKILGYKPSVSLEEGMRRSIEWCRQNGVLF